MSEENNEMLVADESAGTSEMLVEFRRDETEYILEEMFKKVGLVYTPEFVRQPEWYLLHTWTIKEAAEFTTWLAKYLQRRHKGVGKKRGMAEAQWFTLNVGWRQASPTEEI